MSPLQKLRLKYLPKIPNALSEFEYLHFESKEVLSPDSKVSSFFPHFQNPSRIQFIKGQKKEKHPLKIGVVFSGGPAPGGHNVIAGIFDGLKKWNEKSTLLGFLNGPSGILEDKAQLLDEKQIDLVRNQGGFDLLGSGRTKIETEEQFAKSLAAMEKHQLNGLIIVGGDDSNTNAAFLAEYFLEKNCQTAVIGVPKTIDGDLKNKWIETSFGFDSASKTYSESIGNVAQDAASQGKYYFFIKLMGRAASHLVLECALKTHPNYALIGEEIAKSKKSLQAIIGDIADLIIERASHNKNYGVILIPEGVIEFIPEMKDLVEELNTIFAKGETPSEKLLSKSSQSIYCKLPDKIQQQLLLERDPHGNVQVSKIETERLIIELVEKELKVRSPSVKFNPQPLFFGYEGRSCLPSNFDANYCYSLGLTALLLAAYGKTGYMGILRHLNSPIQEWGVEGIPLVSMMEMELRKGKRKPVIVKSLVELNTPAYQMFAKERVKWRINDDYQSPGPIQFFGPIDVAEDIPLTLAFAYPG